MGNSGKVLEMCQPKWRAQIFSQLNPMFLWDVHEYIHNLGIELRAGTPLNFAASVREWQSLSIGPVADHAVHGIGNCKNARSKLYIFALQFPGITGAIKKFLVSQHDFGGIAQERYANEHVVANIAVLPHDLLFFVVQRARLA